MKLKNHKNEEPRIFVRVAFREDRDGDITAVFIDDKPCFPYLGCYAHIGQHNVCSVEWIRKTKPAKNYNNLLNELEEIGYDVEVIKRINYNNLIHKNYESTEIRHNPDKPEDF